MRVRVGVKVGVEARARARVMVRVMVGVMVRARASSMQPHLVRVQELGSRDEGDGWSEG